MVNGLLVVLLTFVLVMLIKLQRASHRQKTSKRKAIVKSIDTVKRKMPEISTPERRFHCVSIESVGTCCEHMKALKGKRFLSKEAPELPMEACTQARCQCRYQHHDDRRQSSAERRLQFGVGRELYGVFGEIDRRDYPKGRRSSDHWSDAI